MKIQSKYISPHTPGPWQIIKGYEIWGHAGEKVCDLGFPEDTYTKGDRNLIAAAPDMLAALEKVLSYAEYYAPTLNGPVDECFKEARAAIAKARGQS